MKRGGLPATVPIHHWFVLYKLPISTCFPPEPRGKKSGHSIMFALVFVGCQTMLLSTSPKVSFVVYIEPASVKLDSVLSLALKRQNCAPQLGARAEVSQPGLLPPPTPTPA